MNEVGEEGAIERDDPDRAARPVRVGERRHALGPQANPLSREDRQAPRPARPSPPPLPHQPVLGQQREVIEQTFGLTSSISAQWLAVNGPYR
jgi:hypothetical protein